MPSRKVLKSVAHNTAHSFTSAMNYFEDDYAMGHLLLASRTSGLPELTVDLLTGEAGPAELLTKKVLRPVQAYCSDFPNFLARCGAHLDLVKSASMVVSFDLSQVRLYELNPKLVESPFRCEVRICDDRGKLHSAVVSGWWFPETGPQFTPNLWSRIRSWFARL